MLRQAFTFTVLMTAINDIANHVLHYGDHVSIWSNIIKYAFMGIFIAYLWWLDYENKYKKAQLNRRLQTSFDDRITPR